MEKESELIRKERVRELLSEITPDMRMIQEEFSHLVGRLLTIIEAVAADKQQRRSLKDIVQKTVYGTRNTIISRLGGSKSE
jgi:hypothetical protein